MAELIVIKRVLIDKKQQSKLCHRVHSVRKSKLTAQKSNLDGNQSKRTFLKNQLSDDEIGGLSSLTVVVQECKSTDEAMCRGKRCG